jgi:hypothetical protein
VRIKIWDCGLKEEMKVKVISIIVEAKSKHPDSLMDMAKYVIGE